MFSMNELFRISTSESSMSNMINKYIGTSNKNVIIVTNMRFKEGESSDFVCILLRALFY